MLTIVIKTGVVFLVTATAIIYQSNDNQLDNSGNQSVEKIVSKFGTTPNKNKNTSSIQPTHIMNLHNKTSEQSKRKSGHNSRKIKISGYLGQTFVYGEVIQLKNGKVEGFIYYPNNSKTYVYGVRNQNRINLYDTNGALYQMLYQK
ncbi:MAG: hypothetical protein V3U88_05620 [Methylococcales bacterium]